MKPGDYIIEAARKQAEGEVAVGLYCGNIKSTGLKTGKSHLCALCESSEI